jgi:CheY-like chemotaxis protein
MPKILLIDDSTAALEIIGTILVDAGYQVVTRACGKCALQLLRREPFDLIVTDIYMPDEDGLEVIRDRGKICPSVPVVAISGVSGKRNMLGVAKRLGACQIVQKPCSKAELLNAVTAALCTTSSGHSACQETECGH